MSDVKNQVLAVGIVMLVIEELKKELGLGWWMNVPIEQRAKIQKHLAARVLVALDEGTTR